MKTKASKVAATKPKATNLTALMNADKAPAKSVDLEVLSPDTGGKKLSAVDSQELERLEVVIQRGIKAYWETRKALWEIHSKRLYREYGTFADYCEKRWGFKRDYGQRVVRAYPIYLSLAEKFKDTKIPLPSTEHQIRPFSKVPQDNWEDTWEASAEKAGDSPITQEIVIEASKPFLSPITRKAAKKWKPPETIKVADLRPLVDELQELLDEASPDVRKILRQIAGLLPVVDLVESKGEIATPARKKRRAK